MYAVLRAVGSSNAVVDGFTLPLATMGIILLSLRYVEQWYFNLAANAAVLTLFIVAALADVSNLSFVISSLVFAVSNVMALISWVKMERAQRRSEGKSP